MATKLRQLRINRVAHVDKGAGHGVQIVMSKRMEALSEEAETYLKRDFSADERKTMADSGAAMPGGGYPIANTSDLSNAIQAIGRAKDPAATKRHIIARAKVLGASDKIPADWTGVGKKLTITHGKDGTVTFVHEPEPGEKTVGKRERVEDALDLLAIAKVGDDGESLILNADDRNDRVAKLWDAGSCLAVSIASIWDDDAVDAVEKVALLSKSIEEFTTYTQDLVVDPVGKATASPAGGDPPMFTAELKKALGLAETATDAECTAAVTKSIEGGKTAAEALEKAQADATFGQNVAKMSDKHAAFMNKDGAKMPKGGKAAFAAMSSGERDSHIASCNDDGGDGMEKRFMANMPEAVKKQLEAGAEAVAKVAKLEDDAAMAKITKSLEPLKHIGDPVEKAKLIHTISKSNPAAADAMIAEFERLDGVIKAGGGTLLTEIGDGRRGVTKASDAINTKAQELIKADSKLTISKARTMVRDQNPELAKQESEENGRRAA